MLLNKILRPVGKQMALDLEKIRTKFSHAGDKGFNVAEVFREFLREYLSHKHRVGHGEIIDTLNNRSGQTDVVIVTDDHPYTITTDKAELFFVEGVSATGEAKTTLNTSHLRTSLESVKKLKTLRKTYSHGTMTVTSMSDINRFYSCPPHFIFAFESDISLSTTVASIMEDAPNVQEAPYGSIDAVFVLNRGWAINFGDGSGRLKFGDSLKGWQWREHEDALVDCLAWLSAVMPVVVRFEPIILQYMISCRT